MRLQIVFTVFDWEQLTVVHRPRARPKVGYLYDLSGCIIFLGWPCCHVIIYLFTDPAAALQLAQRRIQELENGALIYKTEVRIVFTKLNILI